MNSNISLIIFRFMDLPPWPLHWEDVGYHSVLECYPTCDLMMFQVPSAVALEFEWRMTGKDVSASETLEDPAIPMTLIAYQFHAGGTSVHDESAWLCAR